LPDKEKVISFVRAAQKGDEIAFEDLVRAYQDIAVAYASSVLGDYHLAEDAAQEAFVEAHRALPELREPAAFSAWFRAVLYKHCDRLTRRRRRPITGLEAAVEVATPEPSPHEILETRDAQRSVRAAIARLSKAEQQVVLLYYMGEHSTAMIAEFLNVTANTVKTRLYSARKRLRKHMGEIEENLNAARPSSDSKFAEKVRRMIRPEALKKSEPLFWSPGMGADLWELFCACVTGDLEAVKRLLEKDPSLVRANYEYRTPLHFAVRENQIAVTAYLIEHGAKFNFGNVLQIAQDRGYAEMAKLLEAAMAAPHDVAPRGAQIAAAIRERDMEKVRAMLDADPTLIHAPDGHGNQPIHWAVMTRSLEMIDELLARGADIDAQRGDGARPIQLSNGDYDFRGWRDVPRDWPVTPPDVRHHLRARGAYVDICTASFIGDLDRVRELLDQDPSLANRPSEYVTYYACSGTPLRNAAAAGRLEIVRLLLERGADPNLPEEHIAPRGHALHSAVVNGHIEVVRLLLEHGAYPNVEIESSADTLSAALGAAGYSTDQNREMVDLLCSYGAARPVHLLAHCNDLQTAAAVFAANPALADDTAALGSAAGHEGFIRLMLRYQPDLPKRRAVGGRTREITELLFKHGMDPNHPNWLRIMPLHHFAESGDLQNAAIFIEHGADLNARDEEFCSTPLGWAARCGQTRMAEFLLRRGALPNLPDDLPDLAWATPLQWATRRGHDEIVRILEEYERSGAPPPHNLNQYERLAQSMVEAYESGDDAPLQLVMDHFRLRRQLTWDQPSPEERLARFRRGVRERLGPRTSGGNESERLELADARLLVARSLGFADWERLLEDIGS
jgi:RNA polymerase sigma factor (sigma-70 family)